MLGAVPHAQQRPALVHTVQAQVAGQRQHGAPDLNVPAHMHTHTHAHMHTRAQLRNAAGTHGKPQPQPVLARAEDVPEPTRERERCAPGLQGSAVGLHPCRSLRMLPA